MTTAASRGASGRHACRAVDRYRPRAGAVGALSAASGTRRCAKSERQGCARRSRSLSRSPTLLHPLMPRSFLSPGHLGRRRGSCYCTDLVVRRAWPVSKWFGKRAGRDSQVAVAAASRGNVDRPGPPAAADPNGDGRFPVARPIAAVACAIVKSAFGPSALTSAEQLATVADACRWRGRKLRLAGAHHVEAGASPP